MQKNEHKGFVIGSDTYKGIEIWKVRCDDDSEFFQKKFIVATSNVKLSKGMLVTFKLTGVLVSGSKVLQAVEVDYDT